MELIDRAEAIRVADGYCHPSNVPKELEKLPTIKAIPVEVLQEIRQMISDIPTSIGGIGYYQGREVNSYLIDVIKVIDAKIAEYTGER